MSNESTSSLRKGEPSRYFASGLLVASRLLVAPRVLVACPLFAPRFPFVARVALAVRAVIDSSFVFGGWAQLRETGRGSRPPRVPAPSVTRVNANGAVRCSAPLFGALSCALSLGCADNQEPPEPCGAPTPAFRFEATTLHAPLPDNLTLQVEFGGAQSETYELGSSRVGEVACCVTVAHVSDAPVHIPCGATMDAGTVAANAIVCDLWTNGAVDLTVAVSDQVLITQTLHAKLLDEKSDCGQFQTLPAHWVLGEADAGVVVDRH